MSQRVTIKEIAKELGLAHSTVSRVLNGAASAIAVSPQTRERILDTVARRGYVPNVNARSLIRARSSVMGVVIPSEDMASPSRASVADRLLAEAMSGMAEVFRRHDYRMLLIFNDSRFVARREYVNLFKDGSVDGLLVWGARNEERFWGEASSLNVILLNSRNGASSKLPYVGSDNRSAVRDCCLRMLAAGRRSLAYLDCYEGLSISDERFAGYRDALKEAGVPFKSRLCFRGSSAKSCLERFLEFHASSPISIDALQCVNNSLAFAAGAVLMERGFRVPEDVFLAGGDGVDDPYALPLPLTVPMISYRPACRRMGEIAANWAVEAASGGASLKGSELILPVEMIKNLKGLAGK